MNLLQLLLLGSIWGTISGFVFGVVMLLIGRVNPEIMLKNYPPDVRAKYGPMSERTRKQANVVSLLQLGALGVIVILGLAELRSFSGRLTMRDTWIMLIVIFQLWNLIDLVLLDWLLFVTFTPRFMILPGTEGMAGYNDYGFHFQKFLNGIVLTLILSVVVTAVALGIEAMF